MEYKVVTTQYGTTYIEGNTYEDEKGWKYKVGFEWHKRENTGRFTIYCRKPGKIRTTEWNSSRWTKKSWATVEEAGAEFERIAEAKGWELVK